MDDVKVITTYIAAWGWQIISIIFLCSFIILTSLPDNFVATVFSVAFFIMFALSQFVSHKRKKEVYESE